MILYSMDSKPLDNPKRKRRCSKCKKMLLESKFNWKIRGVKLSYQCKQCSREYVRNHYKNNLNYYLRKAKKRNRVLREEAISYIGSYLLSHPCVDCGENNVLVLEFDHRDRADKQFEINKIVRSRHSLSSLVDEISKCDVRCANCHRIKTAKESSSWRIKYIKHP